MVIYEPLRNSSDISREWPAYGQMGDEMIEYCQADVEWFERELADVSRARVGRRLEDVISHRDCVELARASDRITVREAELPKQLVHLDVAAQQERDQAKCAAIRESTLAFQESLSPKLWIGVRNLLLFLGAVALVVWMVVR